MQINPVQNLDLTDTTALQRKRESDTAQDFESVFIQMSLKQMRPSTKDGFLSAGMAEDIFYQFMDEAIAKDIAKSEENFGIADAMKQQMFSQE